MEIPKTRYARSADGTFIAYVVFGEGPDLLVAWPWISHRELFWEDPDVGQWLRSLAKFARVITMDQRGIGLSDRMTQMIDLETKVDDLRAVLDAASSHRTPYGQGVDGGAICSMFAAIYPGRTQGLVMWSWIPIGGHVPDYPWSLSQEERDRFRQLIADTWGDEWIPSGEWMTAQIPGARHVLLPAEPDFPPYLGDTDINLRAVASFLSEIHEQEAEFDRVLATVLFTDIVDSTAAAALMGDAKWRALMAEHDRIAKALIARFRGTYVKNTGDGLMATFDGPARAVRAAQAMIDAVKPLGVDIRTGMHTGEVNRRDGDLMGLGVHVAARVAALAGALTSSAVKDLTAGSGPTFEDAGEHELKPDRWRLSRVVA